MFTGLIEEIGSVTGTRPSGDGRLIDVRCSTVLEGTAVGDSISINGACQTVTEIGSGRFTVFASSVTLSVTTLGSLGTGARVNLERAMSPNSRFGGHFVQGHVDGKGVIRSLTRDSRGCSISVAAGGAIMKYVVAKGSVAVDGISLTVVEVDDGGFSLYVIPETLDKTIIGGWTAGAEVNIEADILAKYVEKMLAGNGRADDRARDSELKRKLAEEGFI